MHAWMAWHGAHEGGGVPQARAAPAGSPHPLVVVVWLRGPSDAWHQACRQACACRLSLRVASRRWGEGGSDGASLCRSGRWHARAIACTPDVHQLYRGASSSSACAAPHLAVVHGANVPVLEDAVGPPRVQPSPQQQQRGAARDRAQHARRAEQRLRSAARGGRGARRVCTNDEVQSGTCS